MEERRIVTELIPVPEDGLVKYPYKEKTPVVLLLDTSGSMEGNPIDELNEGLLQFVQAIREDEVAKKSVEICVIEFGDNPRIDEENSFVLAEDFRPRKMIADGYTPMGEAIDLALSEVTSRKAFLRQRGINLFRPWIVLITDGKPTDMKIGDRKWFSTKEAIKIAERDAHCLCWAFGTSKADMNALKDLFPDRHVFGIVGADFTSVFNFVSHSMKIIARSGGKQEVDLGNPGDFRLKVEI